MYLPVSFGEKIFLRSLGTLVIIGFGSMMLHISSIGYYQTLEAKRKYESKYPKIDNSIIYKCNHPDCPTNKK
jgi:hypothetical protein